MNITSAFKIASSLHPLRSPALTLPPPPHPSLLNSNDPPATDEQRESIHVSINRATDILKVLDDRNETSNPLGRLTSLRDKTLSFIRTQQSILSAIRRIPPEIWSIIFSRYATSMRAERESSQPQFVLAKVCKKWRDIVYGTASLWTCPPAVYLSNHGPRATKDWSDFKSYLDRAAKHPLTLNIACRYNKFYEDVQRMEQLVSHAEQWGDVTAKLSLRVFHPNSVFLQGRLTNLRKVDLTIVGRPDRTLPSDLFAASTKLTDVALWATLINYCPILPPQVRRFEASCNTYKGFYKMVQNAASSLEQCRVVWYLESGISGISDDPTTPDPDSLTFPNLQHLSVEGWTYVFQEDVDELISQITVPDLKHFSINFTAIPERILALEAMFKRSTTNPEMGHCLHTLNMRGTGCWREGTNYSALFRQTPNLVELHVDGLDASTLSDLIITQGPHSGPSLLPKLTRLFMYKPSVWPQLGTCFEPFVRSRTRNSPTPNERGILKQSRCAQLEYVVLTFKKEKACQKAWESVDPDQRGHEWKAESAKLRSLLGPLYSAFKLPGAVGKGRALTKVLSLLENDPNTYDIRSIMEARLPSVLGHITSNPSLYPSLQKRAQDILNSWDLQLRAYRREYHWHQYPATPEACSKTRMKLILVYHQGMQFEDPGNPFQANSRSFSRLLKPKWKWKEFEERYVW